MVVEGRVKANWICLGMGCAIPVREAESRVANLRSRSVEAARWKLTTMDLRWCFAGFEFGAGCTGPGPWTWGVSRSGTVEGRGPIDRGEGLVGGLRFARRGGRARG